MTENAHYIFYRNKFNKNFNYINDCFKKLYPLFKIGYSFKTNNCPSVLTHSLEAGCLAEVVSPQEYKQALETGFTKDKIIYNGVCKNFETVKDCILGGGLVNIDNEEDLNIILAVSQESGRVFDAGLRINFDCGNNIKSHFGINVESPLYKKIIKLDATDKIHITTLHSHFTHSKYLDSWTVRAKKMCQYAKDFSHITALDFGGNMMCISSKDLIDDYAKIITQEVNNSFSDRKPFIILECGTPLIHDSFDLVANVLHIKDGYIITDASIFDLGLENAKGDNSRIKVINCSSSPKKVNNYSITGYTCMENDILKKSWTGLIEKGDKIYFINCGSYSYSWANSFIKEKLEVVVKD